MTRTRTFWTATTLAAAALLLGGCATRMTVQQYVLSKLVRDNPGFSAALEAANAGQTAFNLNADTPIMDIRDDDETRARLTDLLAKSRDAYRRASSYRIEGYSASLQPSKDHVYLTDIKESRSELVPIPGMDISFRVQANRDRIDVQSVESERGLPVLRFDSRMKPTVTRDFYPYLVGDRVEVGGDIREQLRRPSRRAE